NRFELTETGIFLKICVVNFSVLGLFFHRPLDLKEKARPGGDVTLICQAPDGVDITVVEWRRTDSEDLHVFLYRDGHVDSFKQHPSFKNRVELKDKEMKNGDLSVILKNVKKEDSGTYECRFTTENVESNFTEAKPTSTIQHQSFFPTASPASATTTAVVFIPATFTHICGVMSPPATSTTSPAWCSQNASTPATLR
uniref:Ig-like domain-containing protein n=1 Tax=Myripristis murdjan TaxID=586833 RepID=A0A667ZGG4_9TELE